MNALLDHVWGESAAQDHVWAQVAGMAPSRAPTRLLMALRLRAFIDESATYPSGEFVLAGHIAPTEKWALFSKEWEELLPFGGTLADSGGYHFKMSEMATSPERMLRVPAFYWLIEKYVTVSISCRMNLGDFSNAHARMHAILGRMNISWDPGDWKNPYFFIFRALMYLFHSEDGRRQLADQGSIPYEEKVDFYFDDRLVEKKVILAAWDDVLDSTPEESRKFYSGSLRFEKDHEFLPLQAADFWAWWVRIWGEEDAAALPDKMRDFDFGLWRGRKRPLFVMALTEDDIFNTLRAAIFEASEYSAEINGLPI